MSHSKQPHSEQDPITHGRSGFFAQAAGVSLVLAIVCDVLSLTNDPRIDVRWCAPLASAWLNVFIVAFIARYAHAHVHAGAGAAAHNDAAFPAGFFIWRSDWRRRFAAATHRAIASIRWQPWAVLGIAALSLPIAATPWNPLAQRGLIGGGEGAGTAMAPEIFTGAAALLFAFGALVAERFCAMHAGRARAYVALANMLRVAVLVAVLAAAAAAMRLVAGIEAAWLVRAAALINAAIACELALRAMLSWFAPPQSKRGDASVPDSLIAGLLRVHPSPWTRLGAELRERYGIDLRQSWVLRSLVRLAPPACAAMLALAWLLTGVAIVGPDERAVYERFGAPAAVWQPGLHVALPWPFGRVRTLDNGRVRQLIVSGSAQDDSVFVPRVAADAPTPEQLDRLWDVAHQSETSQVIAGGSAEQQSFQIVSADVRLDYRIGPSDAAARAALYRAADLSATVRAIANREVVRYLASHTLASLIETPQTAMADSVKRAVQARLDALASGIEVVAVVIESVHPPAGASAAYHGVQAAQIRAQASVAQARGLAAEALGDARQQAQATVAQALGQAAETISEANAQQTTFGADIAAAQSAGPAFALEYYLHNLQKGLASANLTIIDNRLGQGGRATIDLRSFGGGAGAGMSDAVGVGRSN
ncbi:MAG TPA: SPFH domain-containing protein [Trinickia sp.]|nr:SPFH domain-containing protein [Trinickia sp.]